MDERLIVALDVPTLPQAQEMTERLGDAVSFYKVGMELYYRAGAAAIAMLAAREKRIFLDLKLYDIPNTVARSVRVLTESGVDLLTIHAQGGRAMIAAAREAAEEAAAACGRPRPKLLAVTCLTSFDAATWDEVAGPVPIAERAVRLAEVARAAGADGVIASPEEAAAIRRMAGDDFLIVTPGIRPTGASRGDQQRVATPRAALAAGATHLVIGRPITEADNPRAAALAIVREMEE